MTSVAVISRVTIKFNVQACVKKKYLHLAKLQISRKLASLANLAKLVLT